MSEQRGFTVIEILIVMVVLGALMALAAPSFVRTLRSTTVSSSVNGMMSDIRYTRSEAVKRGVATVMCRSDDPEAMTPVCGSGAGPDLDSDGTGDGWASGWFIFVDLDGDGIYDAADGERILKVQGRNPGIGAIREGSGGSTKLRFVSTGRLSGLAGATNFTFGSSAFGADVQRRLCVNMTGQTRIAGDGSSTCS